MLYPVETQGVPKRIALKEAGDTRFYNKRHNRRGYFWGDRFKSLVVEDGNTLINCLAYIDLNPVRSGIVERPEDYRWRSMGYHVQTGNRDDYYKTNFSVPMMLESEKQGVRFTNHVLQYRY